MSLLSHDLTHTPHRHKTRLVKATLVALFFPIVFTTVALAVTALPDSDPTLDNIRGTRHLLEQDDLLIIAKYTIPYASQPDANVDQAFLFRLFDTDNTTVLAVNQAYPFVNGGYGEGLISFYFDADNAPTFGSAYTIRIDGTPNEFASPPTWAFAIPAGAYSTFTNQENNQIDLAVRILTIARDLEINWSVTLISAGETGTVLSSNGALYFRIALPGIQRMAPSLFDIQTVDPDYTAENWPSTQSDNYSSRFTGTWIGTATSGIGTVFGLGFNYIGSIPIIIAIVACVAVGARFEHVGAGLLPTPLILEYGALMSWVPFAMFSIITILLAGFIAYALFFKSS